MRPAQKWGRALGYLVKPVVFLLALSAFRLLGLAGLAAVAALRWVFAGLAIRPVQAADFLQGIDRETARMGRLVDELLLARTDAGGWQILAAAHGGCALVRPAPGGGACFVLRLPVQKG